MPIPTSLTPYRLFRFDAAGHIRAAAKLIEATDDGDAIGQAKALTEGDRVELWNGARLVVAIDGAKPR